MMFSPTLPKTPPTSSLIVLCNISTSTCRVPICPSKRIRNDYQQHKCRKHYLASGGCPAQGHTVSSTMSNPAGIVMLAIAPPWVLEPPILPTATHLSRSPSSKPPRASTSLTIAPNVFPRYASQMPPIFTQQIAKEQKLSEKHHSLNAECLTKHQVVAYRWHMVCPSS
jgi:hypothetical protein